MNRDAVLEALSAVHAAGGLTLEDLDQASAMDDASLETFAAGLAAGLDAGADLAGGTTDATGRASRELADEIRRRLGHI